jgi:hypothetical protein
MKKDINVGDIVYLTGGVYVGEFAFVLGQTRKMVELQIIRTKITTRVMAYNVTKAETDVKLGSFNKDDHGNVDVNKKSTMRLLQCTTTSPNLNRYYVIYIY